MTKQTNLVPEKGNVSSNVKTYPTVGAVTNATRTKVPTKGLTHEEAKSNAKSTFTKGKSNKPTSTENGTSA